MKPPENLVGGEVEDCDRIHTDRLIELCRLDRLLNRGLRDYQRFPSVINSVRNLQSYQGFSDLCQLAGFRILSLVSSTFGSRTGRALTLR